MTQTAFVGTTGGPPPSSLGPPAIDLGVDPGGAPITFESLRRFLPDRRSNPFQFLFDVLVRAGRLIPGVFSRPTTDRPSGTVTLPLPPGLPEAPPGTFEEPGILATATSEIITIPEARIRRFEIPNLIALPSGGAGGDGMAELPEFFGSRPGFDIFDIPDIAGRIFGNVNAPFGGFGGTTQLNLTTGGAGGAVGGANGGLQVNGNCPPPRARMPSSIMADDPCAPNNPTIYIKAGKAASALWPQVLRSQSKKVTVANKAVRRPARRKRGK